MTSCSDDPDEASPEIETELNRRAFLALHGFRDDWAGDLAALLRSSEPLHRAVRKAMADAIEGNKFADVRLHMTGQKPSRDIVRAISSRRDWMKIGQWIDDRIEAGAHRNAEDDSAIAAAARTFNVSPEKCDKALDYYRRCREWVSQRGGRDHLADVFHATDIQNKSSSS